MIEFLCGWILGVVPMAVLALYINDSWFKELQKTIDEWANHCLELNNDWSEHCRRLIEESRGKTDE